jgi:hypothetical protein
MFCFAHLCAAGRFRRDLRHQVPAQGNFLLGLEWLIVAFSGSNLLIFLLTQSQVSYGISFFLDAFSRGFGIPIVTVLGLMAVTHNFKPSKLKDAALFVITFASTFVMIKADFMASPCRTSMWSCGLPIRSTWCTSSAGWQAQASTCMRWGDCSRGGRAVRGVHL